MKGFVFLFLGSAKSLTSRTKDRRQKQATVQNSLLRAVKSTSFQPRTTMKAMKELLTICHRDNLVQESGPSSVGNDTEKVKKANARDKVLLRMPGI